MVHKNVQIMKRIIITLISFLIGSSLFAQGTKCNSTDRLAQFFEKKHPAGVSDFDIKSYVFDLNVERTSRDISGNVTLQILAKNALKEVTLELHDVFKIDSVLVNKKKVTTSKTSAAHHFSIPISAAAGDVFTTTIFYNGKAPLSTNDWGNGIVQKKDPTYGGDVLYSLTVPYMGHEWFPCKQVLTDLIDSVTMKITTDTSSTVASNGLLISDIAKPNGKHTTIWKTNYPINYYLISFVVGKYIHYDFEVTLPKQTAKLPIRNYVYNAKTLQDKKPVLDNIGALLSNYSTLFGLYPFSKEKFGTIIVPLSGGMEHQTMINLATNYDKYLTAHEMSHQWFGDNVNTKTLHDMWLNEGWASYCEYLTAEKLYPNEAVKYMVDFHNQAYVTNGRVYVDDTTSFSTIYDNARVYAKGAAICHTLRDEIGSDSLFFGAITGIQTIFKNKNIDISDFKKYVEKYTGKDLTLFFNQWYYGYGYPRFTVTYANKNNALVLRSLETGSSTLTPLFKTKLEFLVKRNNAADTTIAIYQSQKDMTFNFAALGSVKSIIADPRNVILDKTTVKEDITLAVTEEELNNIFDIFPNPVQSNLTVTTSVQGSYSLEIYTMDGTQRLKKEKFNEKEINLDISDLANGQYLVKIYAKKKIALIKKIIVIK